MTENVKIFHDCDSTTQRLKGEILGNLPMTSVTPTSRIPIECRASTLSRSPQGPINNLTIGQTGRYKIPMRPLVYRLIFRYRINRQQTSWLNKSLG